MITVERLSKTYRVADKQPGLAGTLQHFVRRRQRDVSAVRDVSFAIAPGEMVGFLGANGAGKTTTLKMLCGLIYPVPVTCWWLVINPSVAIPIFCGASPW